MPIADAHDRRRRSRSAPSTTRERTAQSLRRDRPRARARSSARSSTRSWSANARVAHEHVGLARHQQRVRVDVRRADRRPARRRSTATFACRNERWYSWIATPAPTAAARTARATRSAAAGTRPAPAAAASRATPRARRGDQRAPEADAGEEVRVRDQDLAARRADAGEVGALDVAPVAQVVADRELRGLRAGALGRRLGPGTAARRCAANCASSTIAHTRCIVCTIGDEQRAAHAHREIDARRLAGPGVFMSSMTLMPPTNATRPSTWHSLRCSRRSRCERNCQGCTSGRYLSRSTPPSTQPPLERAA